MGEGKKQINKGQIIPMLMLLKFQLFSLQQEGSKDSTRKCKLPIFKKNLKKWVMNKTSKIYLQDIALNRYYF